MCLASFPGMTTIDVSPSPERINPQSIAGLQHEALSSRARRTRLLGRASLAAPLFAAATGIAFALHPERRREGLALLGASLGLGLVRWQLQRLFTEQVPYEVQAKIGVVEIRRYPAQLWAETTVTTPSWSDALSEGFQRLADYIFGENVPTTLVGTESARRRSLRAAVGGERLTMTAPVLATLGAASELGDRTIAFVMPADRKLEDLPTPRDMRVTLRSVPARRVAVLGFSGDYKSELPASKRDELLQWVVAAGLTPKGVVHFAGYDPPTTLPALRRNEVSVELEPLTRD
jgi:hypothetical protein